jgi:hypothetical protein
LGGEAPVAGVPAPNPPAAVPPDSLAPGIGAAVGGAAGDLLGLAFVYGFSPNACFGNGCPPSNSLVADADLGILVSFPTTVVLSSTLGGLIGALIGGESWWLGLIGGALGGVAATGAAAFAFETFTALQERATATNSASAVVPATAAALGLLVVGVAADGAVAQLIFSIAE